MEAARNRVKIDVFRYCTVITTFRFVFNLSMPDFLVKYNGKLCFYQFTTLPEAVIGNNYTNQHQPQYLNFSSGYLMQWTILVQYI